MSTSAGKSRLPKAYTDQQLGFLKSHLPEFERRTQGAVRGDAKKYALEKAVEFIATFGLPPEFNGLSAEEAEGRFREQIYNWFKNTVGRTRRKLEGRPRSVKKADWTPPPPSSTVTSAVTASPSAASTSQVSVVQQQAGPSLATVQQTTPTTAPAQIPAPAPPPPIVYQQQQPTSPADAFIQCTDPNTLATLILSSLPSTRLQLDPAMHALSHACSQDVTGTLHDHVRLLLNAARLFPPEGVTHASVSGPMAVTTALQMHIRRNSIYAPCPHTERSSSDLAEEMHRNALDRQRKKSFITWARIHAAAIELCILTGTDLAFSELIARDSVWQSDEVEWVAGVYILRALIRTTPEAKGKYEQLLAEYENRWREIRDETRQALVTDVLISARDEMNAQQASPTLVSSPAMHHPGPVVAGSHTHPHATHTHGHTHPHPHTTHTHHINYSS
ncbi:hypothetical protein PQX77_002604 [Marasmius sp. AFHP31]|nr:hypothetical protein PQX77_002604 [Marasmius sp. AFHP31]